MAKKFSLPTSPIETRLGSGLEKLAISIVDEANAGEVDLALKLAALKTAGAFWSMKNKVQPTDPEGSAFDEYGKSLQTSTDSGDGNSGTSRASDGEFAELTIDDLEFGEKGSIVQFSKGKGRKGRREEPDA